MGTSNQIGCTYCDLSKVHPSVVANRVPFVRAVVNRQEDLTVFSHGGLYAAIYPATLPGGVEYVVILYSMVNGSPKRLLNSNYWKLADYVKEAHRPSVFTACVVSIGRTIRERVPITETNVIEEPMLPPMASQREEDIADFWWNRY